MIRVPIVLALMVLFASPVLADALLIAPDAVRAEGDGSFSFTATLVAGTGCVGWTGYGYGGEQNVTGGMYADTFCIDPQPIEPGSTLSFEVRGQLDDPGQYGIVWMESGFCVGGNDYAHTVVLPSSVENDEESWSTLKAKFR